MGEHGLEQHRVYRSRNGFYSSRAAFGEEFLNGSSVLHHLSAEGQKAKGTFSKKLSKLFSISYGSALTTAN